jgi:GNAT superfamily N-acetyltransferase
MIREANKFDKEAIIEMMKEFRDSADFIEILADDNVEYWHRLLDSIYAGAGKVFYQEGKGLLMCVIMPTVWDDKTFALHELAWYVRPEHRRGLTGFRLFEAYINYGKELKQAGRIKYFTMTKLDVSPDLDYGRYGFRKKDENWIQ